MATLGSDSTSASFAVQPRPPRLENGDRLSRDEFERRYAAAPELKKAELIEGVVHVPSPVRFDDHGSPHAALVGWLGHYWAFTPGLQAGDNASVRLDLESEPQPDGCLIIQPQCGGRVRISPDGYIEGSPELVAEVSASTVSIDLNAKLRLYRRHAVQEYVVWRVQERAIDWFMLKGGQFEPQVPDEAGVLRSLVFPGLWLASQAMIELNLAEVLRVLQLGLASAEHAAFNNQLSQQRAS